jgi:hypothetical protein
MTMGVLMVMTMCMGNAIVGMFMAVGVRMLVAVSITGNVLVVDMHSSFLLYYFRLLRSFFFNTIR